MNKKKDEGIKEGKENEGKERRRQKKEVGEVIRAEGRERKYWGTKEGKMEDKPLRHKCEQTGRRSGLNQTHRRLNVTCNSEAGGESRIKHGTNIVRHGEETRQKSNSARRVLRRRKSNAL